MGEVEPAISVSVARKNIEDELVSGVGIDSEVASSDEGHPEEEENPKGGFSQRHASFPHFLTCFQVE